MTYSMTRRAGLGCGIALAAAFLLGAVAPAGADTLTNITKAGVIKIGIFEDFPPFASLNSNMKIEGYDTDVAGLLGKALGVKVNLVAVTGQNRIPFLTEGKVDLLLSVGYSAERAKVIDYTDAYAPYYIAVMGAKDVAVKDAADLAGKTIAVNRGTLEDTEVSKVAPKTATIQRYSDYNGVISAFLSGQVQLMVVGNDVGATILAKNPAIKPVEKFKLMSSPSQMAVKKGDIHLRDAVNKEIKVMKADGSLNAIAIKWLKQPLPAGF